MFVAIYANTDVDLLRTLVRLEGVDKREDRVGRLRR
jgi:hypothetical protein